jgi:murein DD-endopeptidase MepM/ murein hydrolase activator NlpD
VVSHKDDFGVGAPKDSVNPNAESPVDDGIFAELQRKFLGSQATYVPLATEPIPVVATPEAIVTAPEPVLVQPELAPEPVPPAFVIPQVVSQLLVMEQRDRAESAPLVEPVETPTAEAPVLSRRALREQGLLTAIPRTDEAEEPVAVAEPEVAAVAEPVVEAVAEPVIEPEAEPEAVAPILELEKVVKSAKALKPAKVKVVKPKVAKVKRPAIASRARRTSGVVSMVAMAFIAGLAVATSLPANALLTQDQIQAINAGLSEDGYIAGQEVEASNANVITGRDKVSATQWGGVIGGGLYSNVTYVNNPLGTIQWPFRRTVPISDLFGTRENPFGSGTTFHHGMDFNPGEGAPIQVIADGVVSAVVQDAYGGLGYYVIVDHNVKGMVFQSVYGHMKAGTIQVRTGQKVSVTDIVGQVGSTGASTGAHLHFEIRVGGAVIDPLTWLQENTN